MADYHCGLQCVIAEIKSGQEFRLKFVLNGKEYISSYIEKENCASRSIAKLLSTSDAWKASIWNVVSGPPGLGCRSRYVTDIWCPSPNEVEKLRLPEPIFSVVCKISHFLGKDFFICDVGREFPKDVIILPRYLVCNASGNTCPKVGDYVLVSALLILDLVDGVRVSRMIPFWAYWDSSNCSLDSTGLLNVVERGPGHSVRHIPDQIPCMWGVVEKVAKKSLNVYVPCVDSSVLVPKNVIFPHEGDILEEDWLQLWLSPQKSQRGCSRLAEVSGWVCNYCCWSGRAAYDGYLGWRLGEHYVKHTVQPRPQPEQATLTGNVGADVVKPTATPASRVVGDVVRPPATCKGVVDITTPTTTSTTEAGDVGIGKVLLVKEKSGMLLCGRGSRCPVGKHVFHMGLMTVFGVKMASIPGVKMTELVEEGSNLGYRMNPVNHMLRAVWVGPEVVPLGSLDFLPQMNDWVASRKLRQEVVQKMLKSIMDNFEAASKQKGAAALRVEVTKVTVGAGDGGPSVMEAVRGAADGRDDEGQSVEGWSVDSDESEVDELEPLPPMKGSQERREGCDTQFSAEPSREEVKQEGSLGALQHPSAGKVEDSVETVNKENPLLRLVLIELAKFLCKEFVEKGKLASVAEACEVSADFVARLEEVLKGAEQDGLLGPAKKSVGLQTD
ncbi:uncharacterized protein LOC124163442 [Ischnura elegans]|uniref:uncharacterized protein LOC124163442 n=1 Tax=Ischnura elegans TaxID=197161 RepID=UPI001ED86CB1|nr:uncharacterized protein LOC124163442 [Ischnura elegans]